MSKNNLCTADFPAGFGLAKLLRMEIEAGRTLAGLSVLVIEDEGMLRRRIAAHLETRGAGVFLESGGPMTLL